jgi:hypothetical protein
MSSSELEGCELMRANSALFLLVLLLGQGFSQTITTLNLQTQSRNADFSNFPFTRLITVGAAVPATCQVGQLLFNTAAPAGQNIFGCIQRDTWIGFGVGFAPENVTNKNARGGYAGLDANGFFAWVQLTGVPTASSLRAGILSASDWSTFNAKQPALGFTPENLANKGQVNGYAALNASGQVPAAQLPVIPSKTSQLTNDAGFITSARAQSAAPVRSVNGQVGNVIYIWRGAC